LFQGSPEFLQRTVYWYVFLAPALLSLALLAATGASRLKRWSWAAAIVVAVELIALGSRRPANTESVRDLPYVTATAVDGSEEAAQKLRQWAGDLRIDTAGDSLALMAGAPVLRWRAANGYDPLALEHLVRLRLEAARGERWGTYYEIEQPDSPALDWMSIRVVTSREQLVTQKLTEAGLIPGRWVYLNPGALLRYRAAGCVVKIVRESRNRIELDTWCQREALLETSEMHYSAWRAAIDGGPGNIELVRGAFRGVRIPPGHHQVVFRYSAWLVAVCGVVSLCGWTAWVWLWRKASRGSFN
jgi:hypothetical protein